MQSRVPHMLQQLLTGPSAGVGVPAVSIWLSVSHIIAEEFWPIFLYSVSVHWGLWACCCLLLTSLHVPLQHFEVWTLTGRLPHLDSFLFQLYSRRFAALGITILLLHDPNSAKLYFSFRTDGLTFDSRRESCGCKTNPIHYPTTTVFKS